MKSGVTHLLLHPTGMYPSDIPAQVCTETTYPFPARIILSSANANAGYYKQYTIAYNSCPLPDSKRSSDAQTTRSVGTCGQMRCILTVY